MPLNVKQQEGHYVVFVYVCRSKVAS